MFYIFQVKNRFVKRSFVQSELGVTSDELYIYSETNLEQIHQTIEEVKPKFVIVDSIQTVHHPEVTVCTRKHYTSAGMYS